MTVTKAIYEQVADVLRHEARVASAFKKRYPLPGPADDVLAAIDGITEGLIEVFERDNDRFDIHLFEKAAGRGTYF